MLNQLNLSIMLIKVIIPIQSHLSDALIETDFAIDTDKTRIRFTKWLLNKFSDNLNVEVDIEKEFELFKNQ